MNRREAIAALMGLPAVASIAVAQVQPDDVIVIESDVHLSLKQIEHFEHTMAKVWPGRKVVVLGPGTRLRIARASTDDGTHVDAGGGGKSL